MKRMLLIGLPLLVLAFLAGGATAWLLLDDTPPEAALPAPPSTSTTVAVEATAPPGTDPARATPDGTWAVEPGEEVFAGYRIAELFAGETVQKEAVGRSPAVTGSMTVAGAQVTAASLTVDLTQLASDQPRRDSRLRVDGLQTDTFPTATFTLTQPVTLPVVAIGTVLAVDAVGDLTLHGVTRPVTVALQARWNGESIDLAGRAPIVLADFGIAPPSIENVVEVAADGVFELQLRFVPA